MPSRGGPSTPEARRAYAAPALADTRVRESRQDHAVAVIALRPLARENPQRAARGPEATPSEETTAQACDVITERTGGGIVSRPRRITSVDYVMNFWVKDFFASTMTMSGPEAAAYALSLLVAWSQGASLPTDVEKIRRALRYDQDEWATIWPAIESKWKITADATCRVNGRMKREWEDAQARLETYRRRSRVGNQKRWPRDGVLEGILEGVPEGVPEGVLKGVPEGVPEGVLEGIPEGSQSLSLSLNPSLTGKELLISEEVGAAAAASSRKHKKREPLSNWKIKVREGDEWPIPYPVISPYEEKLEADAIERELDKLVRKTHSVPSCRPTRRGARRCVANWLEKAIEFTTQREARP